MTKQHYPAFDYLRLFLALEVVRLHSFWAPNHPVFLPYNPVPSFLALSGFMVLQSYENSRSWYHFAWKRICRIVPALLASFVLIGIVLGAKEIWPAMQTYLTMGLVDNHSLNGPLWSLGVEEIAYGLLAVLFALGAYKAKWPIWVMLVASAVFAELPLSGYVLQLRPIPFYFFAGNLVYLYKDKFQLAPLLTVAALIIVPMARLTALPLNPALMLGPVALLAFGLCGPKLPRLKVDLSYGIYIYHCIFLCLFIRQGLTGLTLYGATLTSALVFAYASWKLIELPALRLKNLDLRNARDRRVLSLSNDVVVVPLPHRSAELT